MLQWFGRRRRPTSWAADARWEIAFHIMKHGTTRRPGSSPCFEQTKDLKAVVDRVVSETAEGVRPEIVQRFTPQFGGGGPMRNRPVGRHPDGRRLQSLGGVSAGNSAVVGDEASAYVLTLTNAGAVPWLIPLVDDDTLRDAYDELDGVFLTGWRGHRSSVVRTDAASALR